MKTNITQSLLVALLLSASPAFGFATRPIEPIVLTGADLALNPITAQPSDDSDQKQVSAAEIATFVTSLKDLSDAQIAAQVATFVAANLESAAAIVSAAVTAYPGLAVSITTAAITAAPTAAVAIASAAIIAAPASAKAAITAAAVEAAPADAKAAVQAAAETTISAPDSGTAGSGHRIPPELDKPRVSPFTVPPSS